MPVVLEPVRPPAVPDEVLVRPDPEPPKLAPLRDP